MRPRAALDQLIMQLEHERRAAAVPYLELTICRQARRDPVIEVTAGAGRHALTFGFGHTLNEALINLRNPHRKPKGNP